jgi:ParB family chromosome partitioning protein
MPLADLPEGERFAMLPLESIERLPDQPRRALLDTSLEELAQSIRDHGVLQPVRVRRVGPRYELVAGERRWTAARLAGLHTIPAVIVERNRDEAYIEALVENIQRRGLSIGERADALLHVRDVLGLDNWEDVGRTLGISRGHVHRLLRVITVPPSIREALGPTRLTEKHVRALHRLRHDQPAQLDLARRILAEDLSGDAALRLCGELLEQGDKGQAEQVRRSVTVLLDALRREPALPSSELRQDLERLRDELTQFLGEAHM